MNKQQNQNKTADGQSRAGEAGANLTDVLGDALQIAFVQGAAWWEQRTTGGTMWQRDRSDAEAEAFARACNGTLGWVSEDKQ